MRIRDPGWRQFGSGSATMIHKAHLFIRRGLSPFLHCVLLRGKNLPGVTSRDSNSSLPYCTAGQRTTNWDTLHSTELRCTLIWKFIVLLSPLLSALISVFIFFFLFKLMTRMRMRMRMEMRLEMRLEGLDRERLEGLDRERLEGLDRERLEGLHEESPVVLREERHLTEE